MSRHYHFSQEWSFKNDVTLDEKDRPAGTQLKRPSRSNVNSVSSMYPPKMSLSRLARPKMEDMDDMDDVNDMVVDKMSLNRQQRSNENKNSANTLAIQDDDDYSNFFLVDARYMEWLKSGDVELQVQQAVADFLGEDWTCTNGYCKIDYNTYCSAYETLGDVWRAVLKQKPGSDGKVMVYMSGGSFTAQLNGRQHTLSVVSE